MSQAQRKPRSQRQAGHDEPPAGGTASNPPLLKRSAGSNYATLLSVGSRPARNLGPISQRYWGYLEAEDRVPVAAVVSDGPAQAPPAMEPERVLRGSAPLPKGGRVPRIGPGARKPEAEARRMELAREVAARVKQARMDAGLTVRDMAAILGVESYSSACSYELAKARLYLRSPFQGYRDTSFYRAARHFGIDCTELLAAEEAAQ